VDIKSETQLADEEAYAGEEWAQGEWIVDPETGEQVWVPAEGGPALSAEEWAHAGEPEDEDGETAGTDEAAADDASGEQDGAPDTPAPDAEPDAASAAQEPAELASDTIEASADEEAIAEADAAEQASDELAADEASGDDERPAT
jgi:hypothetical protein